MAKDKTHRAAPAVAADVQRAADTVAANLSKKYGAGIVQSLGSRLGIEHPCIKTGLYQLDHDVIQAGGFPQKRITEVFGPESSGKTTITLQVIAEAQRQGGLAGFVDAEHALDPNWAAKLGVDVDKLVVSQPDSGEQALDVTEELVRSGAFSIIVVDSVAALVPQAELDGEMGDSHVGLQARLMSQGLRKLTGAVSKTNTALVFINQIREKIGVMFGSPETTTGGRALKFYASLRLDVRRIATIKDGDRPIGNRTKFKAVKNKVGAPFRECEVDLLYESGFNTVGSVVDAGVANGAIQKAGAWFSFGTERLGQGRDAVCALLRENEEFYQRVYDEVRAKDLKEQKAA